MTHSRPRNGHPATRWSPRRAWLAGVGLLAFAAPLSAQVIVNGEMNGVADFSIFNGVEPSGWASIPGTTDLLNETTTYVGSAWQASAGGSPFVHGAGTSYGQESIEQVVSGLTVGQEYKISFEQTASDSYWTSSSAGFWRVSFGADTLDSDLVATPPFGTPAPWVAQELTFVATATSQLLEFTAFYDTSGLRADMGLDSVRIEEGCSSPPVPGSEVVRLGTPPNPYALIPSSTGPPVIGEIYDPSIDHTTFVPSAVLDVYGFFLFPANVDSPPMGTILCSSPVLYQFRLPADSLNLPIPDNCSLVGMRLCLAAASLSATSEIFLTNALDLIIGNI